MKIKATLTINLGTYMDIRPEIEIDTENVKKTRELIYNLHEVFYGMLRDDVVQQKRLDRKLNEKYQKKELDHDLDVQKETDEVGSVSK